MTSTRWNLKHLSATSQRISTYALWYDSTVRYTNLHRQFVNAILTNLGRLPADRIQGMLKLVSGPPLTLEETLHLLDMMKQNGWIECRDGLWALKIN